MSTISASDAFTISVSPITGIHVSTTSNIDVNKNRCGKGSHRWTYAGQLSLYDLEGMPCDCGEVIYHTEICPACGERIINHKKVQ